MDTNRSDFGAVEDLMLSSNRHDLDSLLPHLDLTLYTTPKLPMDMPLDLWTLKLNLNWINRSSTLFCFFFFLEPFSLLDYCCAFPSTVRRLVCSCFWIYGLFDTHPGKLSVTDCSLFVWTSDHGYPEQDSIMLLDGM